MFVRPRRRPRCPRSGYVSEASVWPANPAGRLPLASACRPSANATPFYCARAGPSRRLAPVSDKTFCHLEPPAQAKYWAGRSPPPDLSLHGADAQPVEVPLHEAGGRLALAARGRSPSQTSARDSGRGQGARSQANRLIRRDLATRRSARRPARRPKGLLPRAARPRRADRLQWHGAAAASRGGAPRGGGAARTARGAIPTKRSHCHDGQALHGRARRDGRAGR